MMALMVCFLIILWQMTKSMAAEALSVTGEITPQKRTGRVSLLMMNLKARPLLSGI